MPRSSSGAIRPQRLVAGARAKISERLQDPNWEHSRAGNNLQRVPFLIDQQQRLLVETYGLDVMGHGPEWGEVRKIMESGDLSPQEYNQLLSEARKRWADEHTVADDISTAKYVGDRVFYLPRNVDKRGRVYSVPHFNYERDDRVRSMIKFANGMKLAGHIEQLEIHCANCEGSTAKQRRSERIKWTVENCQKIQAIANDPFGTFGEWKAADDPFCYAVACRELAAAWRDPENYITHLPVGFDGTANGLQHLALLIRDPIAGRMVNLIVYIDGEGRIIRDLEPQDVYGIVAAKAVELLKLDDREHARWWRDRLEKLERRQIRKLLKRPVMTFAYSVTLPGATLQIAEAYSDLRQERPPKGAFRYLAEKVLEACRLLLPGPARVMDYIRDVAQHRMDQGEFLWWTSPSDYDVLNRHHRSKEPKRIKCTTYGVTVRHSLALEFEDEPWRTKTVNAAAANFVHSRDASHLVRVVNAANREGITDILPVHDCYYFLAPQAVRGSDIILEQLQHMYEFSQPLADLHSENVSNPDLFRVPPNGIEARWKDGTRILMPDGSKKARWVLPLHPMLLAENAFG
jgi:Autographiviridae RNA polymerase